VDLVLILKILNVNQSEPKGMNVFGLKQYCNLCGIPIGRDLIALINSGFSKSFTSVEFVWNKVENVGRRTLSWQRCPNTKISEKM